MSTRAAAPLQSLPVSGEHANLLDYRRELPPLTRLVLSTETRAAIDRVIDEHARATTLAARGLRPARRLLFHGPPGCGKTAAAGALALALGVPFAVVRLDGLIHSFLGGTASNLRKVFDVVESQRLVLLIDEFDAVGASRMGGDGSSAGAEMHRVVNSLLTMLEQLRGLSVVIAATNHEEVLDAAVWRRFDEVVSFGLPSGVQGAALLIQLVRRYEMDVLDERAWPKRLAGLPFADVERIAMDAVKAVVMDERVPLRVALLDALARMRARPTTAKPRRKEIT